MKAEELLEMAKGFDEIAKAIKNGEISAEEFKTELNLMIPEIDKAMVIANKLVDGESVEEFGIGEMQRQIILEQFEEENKKFNYKEHKKLVVKLLNLVHSLDKSIETELFLPFMITILERTMPLVIKVNPEGAKSMRKGIKKFNKNIEIVSNPDENCDK